MEKIAFDLDGVIINLHPVLNKICMKRHGVEICKNTTFHLEAPGISDLEMARVVNESLCDWEAAKPYDGYEYALESSLKYSGEDKITFLTARPKSCFNETISWLEKWVKPHVGYRVVMNPHEGKGKWLWQNAFTCLIEDRLKNANAVAKEIKEAILVNRPWNMGRQTYRNVIRMNDLFEVGAYFSLLNKQGCCE